MKFLLILAALAAVAHAELEIFVGSKQIFFDPEILKKLDVTNITVTRGNPEARELDFADDGSDDGEKNIVNDKIVAMLKDIGSQMDQGWPDLGIPPLDPFKMDTFSTKFGVPLLFRATMTLDKISVVGIQSTIIENINFNLIRLTFACAFDTPEINYDSKVKVKGWITLVVPFRIGGNLKVKLSHFRMSGQMSLGTTPDGYLTLKTMALKLSVDKTQVRFDPVFGIGPITDIMNWILNLFTNGIIKNMITEVGEQMSAILFELINEQLGKIKLTDLIG